MALYYLLNVNNNKRFIIPESYNIGEYIRDRFDIFGISETDTKMMSDSVLLAKTLKNGWVRIAYFPEKQSLLIDHYNLSQSQLKQVLERTQGVSESLQIQFNNVANRDKSYSIDKEKQPSPQLQQEPQLSSIINKIKKLFKS